MPKDKNKTKEKATKPEGKKLYLSDVPDNTKVPLPADKISRMLFTFMNPIIQAGNQFPYQFKMLFKHERFIDREIQKELIRAYLSLELLTKKDYTIFSFYR